MSFKKDINPYISENDTSLNLAFKAGFLACIKSVEDKGYHDLKELLYDELNKISKE